MYVISMWDRNSVVRVRQVLVENFCKTQKDEKARKYSVIPLPGDNSLRIHGEIIKF